MNIGVNNQGLFRIVEIDMASAHVKRSTDFVPFHASALDGHGLDAERR